MGRAILGVILGYLAMVVVVVVSFTALQFGLGTEKVFKPASYEASSMFLACAIVISVIAAVIGGLACAAIARRPKPVLALAIVVLVLGAINAATHMNVRATEPRLGNISPMEAAQRATQPAWYLWSLPVIGAVGALIGGRLKKPAAV